MLGIESPEAPQAHWYATYTSSRREKQVSKGLSDRGVECFLPLYKKTHHWSHDTRTVQLPLFPGYVFVHICQGEQRRILETPGVVRVVSFHGEPAALPDSDIDALRRALDHGGFAEPHPYIRPGQRVEVRRGPFQGLKGTVRRTNSNHLNLIVTVDLLMQAIMLHIDADDLSAC